MFLIVRVIIFVVSDVRFIGMHYAEYTIHYVARVFLLFLLDCKILDSHIFRVRVKHACIKEQETEKAVTHLGYEHYRNEKNETRTKMASTHYLKRHEAISQTPMSADFVLIFLRSSSTSPRPCLSPIRTKCTWSFAASWVQSQRFSPEALEMAALLDSPVSFCAHLETSLRSLSVEMVLND